MYHQCPASWGVQIPREPSELYSHFEQHILNFDAKTEDNIEICTKIAKNIVNVVNSCIFFHAMTTYSHSGLKKILLTKM